MIDPDRIVASSLKLVGTKAAWKSAQVNMDEDGVRRFSTDELAEIDLALRRVRSLDLPQITKDTFVLANLGTRLAAWRNDLRRGVGFLLLKGLDRDRYSADDMARIFYGVSVHLGVPIPQSFHGELLGSVIDISSVEHGTGRSYHGGGELIVHSEGCDIVALMCWRKAKSGGESRIASAVAIHDWLVTHRPELAAVLYQGMAVRRPDADAQAGSGKALRETPIVTFAGADSSFVCCYSPPYAYRAEREGDSTLTPFQREALDLVGTLARRPEFYIDMPIGEGDMQFLNDRVTVHARTDYEDHEDLQKRRHLFRVRLMVPEWSPRGSNTLIHTEDDFRGWIMRREQGNDLPVRFLARVRARIAAQQANPSSAAPT